MTVDNNENLIINIGGKTQCFDKNYVKKMISAYFSAQGEVYPSYVANNESPKTFCARYNKEQEEHQKELIKNLAIPEINTGLVDNGSIKPNHYNEYKIKPIDFILKNEIPFCEANVIKYICRWKKKNGIEDLQKAKEYIDILIKNEQNGK